MKRYHVEKVSNINDIDNKKEALNSAMVGICACGSMIHGIDYINILDASNIISKDLMGDITGMLLKAKADGLIIKDDVIDYLSYEKEERRHGL